MIFCLLMGILVCVAMYTGYSSFFFLVKIRPAGRGAEGVTVRGPGNTGGPGVQNCQV